MTSRTNVSTVSVQMRICSRIVRGDLAKRGPRTRNLMRAAGLSAADLRPQLRFLRARTTARSYERKALCFRYIAKWGGGFSYEIVRKRTISYEASGWLRAATAAKE